MMYSPPRMMSRALVSPKEPPLNPKNRFRRPVSLATSGVAALITSTLSQEANPPGNPAWLATNLLVIGTPKLM